MKFFPVHKVEAAFTFGTNSFYFRQMMRDKLYGFTSLVIMTLIVGGCGPNPQPEETTASETFVEIEGVPFTRNAKHDTVLFIAHTVADYDVWKASFDLAEPVREKHGITVSNVYREKNDISLALVYTKVTNLESAKEYVTSNGLQKSMQTAGVKGAMDLYWLTQELAYNKPVTDTILMFMSFKVISYDRWEKAFLDDYRQEPDRDFQVISVHQGIEDEGVVCMVFAVNDPFYVQKMEKDNAFRAKMLAAGVISYPVTYKLIDMPI